jgi:sugar phosphate isomerase/epimerase
MRLGILSKVFARPSLEAVLDAVAGAGLECVQFNMESAGLIPVPDEIPAGLPERVREAAAARGLGIATVQGTFNMSHPDAEFRRAGLRRFRLIVDACAPLGTSIVAICIGTRNRDNMWGHHLDNGTAEAWREMSSCVREAVRMAEDAGVTLAMEPEVTNIVDSAEKARRLMDEIGSPHLKVTMDGANLFHAGELSRMAEVLEHAFTLVGHDIVVAHAKDLSRDGEAGHEAAGHGLLDYGRYLSLLRAYDFDGPLLLHGLSEAQVPGCVAFLRKGLGSTSS